MLPAVDDLIERAARGARLRSERLPLADGESEVVLFESVHFPTIPTGTVEVNTCGSFTHGYNSATIAAMENYERLQALLTLIKTKYCGGTAAELARRIERSDSYVNRLFYPQGKNGAKGIGPEITQACTAAFDLPRGFWEMSPEEAALEIGNAPKPAESPAPPAMPDGFIPVDPAKAHRIWVVGKGAGGLSERIWTDGDHPVGATDQFGLVASTDRHAFLVEVSEESMTPKYTPGDFALVEPGTSPEIEDDVLVRLKSGATMIKRLLSQRGGYRLGSYNSTAVLHYRAEDVDWVYYIAHPVPRRKITTLW